MATEAKKVQIAAAAVTALKGATRAKGYLTDLGNNVLRRRAAIYDLNATNFPRAAVFFAEAEDEGSECIGGARYRTTAVLIVEGLLRQADIEDEVIRFDADAKRALLTENTLGGTCEEIAPATWKSDWLERTDFERGISRVAFEVKYLWNASAP